MSKITTPFHAAKTEQVAAMQSYYYYHAKIYDLTRWSFLFGRKKTIQNLHRSEIKPKKILEVGCGTGYNIQHLATCFPNAEIIGMDVSAEMLDKAKVNTKKFGHQIEYSCKAYALDDSTYNEQLDIILFSYSLTMINPQWESLIIQASKDLKPGGLIAVVDFHNSPFRWFKTHMQHNHVRMDGHLLPILNQHFINIQEKVNTVYGGLWQYFTYLGMKPYQDTANNEKA